MKVDFLDVGVSYKQAIEISNYFKNFGVIVLPAHYKDDFFDFDTEYPIWYGSRVSAKSYVKAVQLLYKASNNIYSRTLFTRETQKDARESQYQLFEDLITKIYPFLQDEFYLETSKMRVTHKNGNFLKGASFENLPRSLAEYTDFWVDEPITRKSSISRTDLLDISGTLRNSYGMKSQKHLTFNPISKTTFIYTDFFSKNKVFECKPLLCNYQHNVFCPPEKIKELEWYKDIDYERYLVDSLGLWGDPKSDRPFIRAVDYDKMVVDLSDEKYTKYKYSKALPVYISLDFNEKWTATIKQIHGKTKVYYESLHDYPEELIRELALKYGSFEVKITGDASGRNNNQYTSDASKKTAWLLMKSEFNKYCTQFYGRSLQMQQNAYFDDSFVTTANIGHDASRTMCNALIHKWGETNDIYFDEKGCRELISDFKRIDANIQGGLDKTDLNKKDIGHCFIGSTKVLTIDGEKNISDINVGEYVLTRKGYKKVLASGVTRANAEVYTYEITLNNEVKKITCTKDHKFYINGEFKEVSLLTHSDILTIFVIKNTIWKKLSLMALVFYHKLMTKQKEKSIIKGGLKLTEYEGDLDCINTFGLKTLEKSQKDSTFTTLTKIFTITKYQIYSVLATLTTTKSIGRTNQIQRLKKCEPILITLDTLQKNGTVQKKVKNGIAKTQKRLGKIGLFLKKFVNVAAQSTKLKNTEYQGFAQTNVSLNTGETQKKTMFQLFVKFVTLHLLKTNILKQSVVKSVLVSDSRIEDVYCLTVEDENEFFAEKTLVHNCLDTFRYDVCYFHFREFRELGMYEEITEKYKRLDK